MSFRGIARVLLVVTVVALGAALSSAGTDSPPKEGCSFPDDPLAELLLGAQTPMAWPAKQPKAHQRDWRGARRRGLHPLVTTLYSVHSRESVPVLEGRLPPDDVIDQLFRCRGFGERRRLDHRLLEAILAVASHFEAPRVEIISAYRSPKFNDTLAKKGRRVAAESRHTKGEAIDFGLPGVPTEDIGRFLWEQHEGGVGTYSRDGFVHVDVGPKRRWQGR